MMLDGGRPRVATAVAVAAGWLITGATVAMAATGGITLAADAGLDGVTRPGRFTRVRIAIENSGTDVAGNLVVVAGSERIARVLNLPAPSRKRFELYIRVPSADVDRIHVALVADGREVGEADAVIRFAPEESPFVLCVGSMSVSDPRCTSTLDATALPDSWRGYDAVDEWTPSPVALSSLTDTQRVAVNRWTLRHANDMSAGLAAEPDRPAQGLSQTRILIAAYAATFLLIVAAAQILARRSLSIYAAVVSIVAVGSAAAMAQGRIGAGASIALTDSTVVRASEVTNDTLISTRGVARFPAFGSFDLSPAFADGIVTMRQTPAGATFGEDGESALSGVFGKGQRVEFDLEGFSALPTVNVMRSADTIRIVNAASGDLTDCELPSGVSPRRVALLRAGDTLGIQGSPDSEDTALACRFQVAPSTIRSRRHHVQHQGRAMLVYRLGPFAGHRP